MRFTARLPARSVIDSRPLAGCQAGSGMPSPGRRIRARPRASPRPVRSIPKAGKTPTRHLAKSTNRAARMHYFGGRSRKARCHGRLPTRPCANARSIGTSANGPVQSPFSSLKTYGSRPLPTNPRRPRLAQSMLSCPERTEITGFQNYSLFALDDRFRGLLENHVFWRAVARASRALLWGASTTGLPVQIRLWVGSFHIFFQSIII